MNKSFDDVASCVFASGASCCLPLARNKEGPLGEGFGAKGDGASPEPDPNCAAFDVSAVDSRDGGLAPEISVLVMFRMPGAAWDCFSAAVGATVDDGPPGPGKAFDVDAPVGKGNMDFFGSGGLLFGVVEACECSAVMNLDLSSAALEGSLVGLGPRAANGFGFGAPGPLFTALSSGVGFEKSTEADFDPRS